VVVYVAYVVKPQGYSLVKLCNFVFRCCSMLQAGCRTFRQSTYIRFGSPTPRQPRQPAARPLRPQGPKPTLTKPEQSATPPAGCLVSGPAKPAPNLIFRILKKTYYFRRPVFRMSPLRGCLGNRPAGLPCRLRLHMPC
jgi:hypothetical protein